MTGPPHDLDPEGPDLTTAEVAKRLRIRSPRSVHAYIRKQRFPNAYRTEGQWRIPQADLINYITQRSTST
jgi:hypothetical protein